MKTQDNPVMVSPCLFLRVTAMIMTAFFVWFSASGNSLAVDTKKPSCTPTAPDALGPFYKPDAPFRDTVGKGYVLEGRVMSASDCAPIAGAVIEFWLAGPEGDYLDTYRATMKVKPDGSYRFECAPPPPYEQRPPHIHVRVSAPAHRTLVTQHYPTAGSSRGSFDLVLIPQR